MPGDVSSFADLTTLRVGGPIARTDIAESAAELIEAVRSADATRLSDAAAAADADADAEAEAPPMLLIGGGSNLVGADGGWDGTAVLVRSRGVTAIEQDDDHVVVEVAAGHPWDEFVAESIEAGWSGLETLSGVPGLTGGAVVQNIGAYGSDIAAVIVAADVLDRDDRSGTARTLGPDRLRLGYRTSALKGVDRFVLVSARFRLRRSSASGPLRYHELAKTLHARLGSAAPLADVRGAVLGLRAAKGMVLDGADHDTWSAGSFFTNPVLAQLPPSLQHLPPDHPAVWSAASESVGAAAPESGVKISAGWLIREAGFEPGFALPGSSAGLSTKHVLAITNRGGATGAQIRELADHVAGAVDTAFGITLRPEPILL